MKAQQILNSFLPGVTVAVLTTQPAWADTLTVENSHSGVYPSVFTLSTSSEDVLRNTYIQKKATVDKKYPAPNIPTGVDLGKLKPANHPSMGVTVAGKTGVLVKAIRRNNQKTKTISLKQALKKTSSSRTNQIANPAIEKKLDDRMFHKLQQIARGPGAAELLEVKSCPTQQHRGEREQNNSKLQTLLSASASSACQRITSISNHNKLAQSVSPVPVQPPKPAQNKPAQNLDSLKPSPNPLQYPTKPEEVRVEQAQSVTLQQALELARRNNQDLQVSLLQLERAKSAVKVAQAALLPSLALTGQISRSQSSSTELTNEVQENAGLQPQQEDTPTTSFNGAVELNYDLYTSGARLSRIRQAEEQLRLQELEVERLSEEIRLNVTTEYYNLQQADEQVRISRSAVVNAEASLRDARALEEAGVGTRFDSLRTQVNLANAQQTLTNARSQQRIARRALVTRLNLAQSATITAADPVKLAGLWNQTLENSIILAYQNRPELQQQIAQRNINEQVRREALSQLGPQFRVTATYDILDQFDDDVGVTDGYSLALIGTLNLYDGGASRAQAAQAKADIEIAETQFSQQRNNIRFQVEEAFSNQQSNLENVQTSEAALSQARESLRLARLRFQAGVGTQLEVLDAENALTEAEGNRVDAILDYNRALANLQRAVTLRALRNR